MALRERVRRNFEYILDHLNLSIIDYLLQEGVLEWDEYCTILIIKADTKEACRQLLIIMMRKSDDKFETFFDCLDSRGGIAKKYLKDVPEENAGSSRSYRTDLSSVEDIETETHGEPSSQVMISQQNLMPSPFIDHGPTRVFPVSCPILRMHPGLANKSYCTVTPRGHLENRPPGRWSWGGLMQYRGTISVQSLNPNRDVQYWETHSDVRMASGVLESGDSILEMGIAEEGSVDSNYNVRVEPRYWCVTVSCCSLHRSMICTSVWQQGRLVVCHTISRHHTPGAQRLLWFGIGLNIRAGRIVFIDVARQVVLAVLDTQFRQSLFPMFGISVRQYYCAVTMELISGNNIHMTDRKRWLISDAMSH